MSEFTQGQAIMAHKAAEEAAAAALVPPARDLPAAGPQAISFPGDADPGGRDDVAGTVAGAQSNAEARWHEHQADTYAQGSRIGDLADLPSAISDMSKHTGSPDSPLSGPAG